MAYTPYRLRSTKRVAKNAKRRFLFTIILTLFLLFAAFQWILPAFVGGVTSITGLFKKPVTPTKAIAEDATLAPPVLSIPFEATNTAQINISGYATTDSKVEIYRNDNLIQTVDVTEDGSFTASDVTLNLGSNDIYGKTLDSSNKESLASKTLTVTYSKNKPLLQITQPDDNTSIQGGDKKITFSGKTDPGDTVLINNSQVIVDQKGKFNSTQMLNDGDNNFSIKAIDTASNTTELTRKVTYQTPTPTPEPTASPTPNP